jgi:hypothetical protein
MMTGRKETPPSRGTGDVVDFPGIGKVEPAALIGHAQDELDDHHSQEGRRREIQEQDIE